MEHTEKNRANAQVRRGKATLRAYKIEKVFQPVIGKISGMTAGRAEQQKPLQPAPAAGETEAKQAAAVIQTDPEALPSITVIIPTYKPNDLIADAIRSCLEQDYPEGKIEIIVSVNGKDTDYAAWLTEQYKDCPQVRVVYTPTPGASAGRNYGRQFVRTEFATYLDDDDYFTKGYLKELAGYATEDVTLVCGWILDITSDGEKKENPYYQKLFQQHGGKVYDEPWVAGAHLAGPCMKLYRTSQLKDVWGDFDETLLHTEDTVWWAENIYKPMGKTAITAYGSGEAYIRRLQADSLSRPSAEKAFQVHVVDMLAINRRFAAAMLQEDRSAQYREFVRGKLNSANNRMYRYFDSCTPAEKQAVTELVRGQDNPFLNKSKLSSTRAIAFCHDFTQITEFNAFVATKRLDRISEEVGQLLNWTVISSLRKSDRIWEKLFAMYRYTEKRAIAGSQQFDEVSQQDWAEKAFAETEDLKADYIYSGGKFACSHAAALKYKRAHPETVWIAEFAEPLSVASNNRPRKAPFWRELEESVFQEADKIIFNCEDQKEYMLAHRPADLAKKAFVWPYPAIDPVYARIDPVKYATDPDAINIGYFDSFGPGPAAEDLLQLLANPAVQLHIFGSTAPELEKKLRRISQRIHIHPPVSYLQMLSLGEKMDYLYLADMPFPGPCSPYLPEKLTDFLAIDRPVIAKVYPNTPMSKLEHERLIKVEAIDAEFAAKLKKLQT